MSVTNLIDAALFPPIASTGRLYHLGRSMFSRLRWHLPAALLALVPVLLLSWTVIAVYAASPSPSGSPGASPSGSPGANLPGDPVKGQQLFGANSCASCHGSSLGGGVGPKLAPIQKLSGVTDPKDPNYIKTTIHTGRPGTPDGFGANMPSFPQLSDKDLSDLAAYILQQQTAPHTLGPVELARSNVFWVSFGIGVLCLLTYLLARYNMRWIDRRAVARRERERLR